MIGIAAAVTLPQFTIAAGQTKDLNINFDACASIVSQGNGNYRLEPILHAGEVALTSTSIFGNVIDGVSRQAISNGTTAVALEQKDSGGVDRVVMETVADTLGNFVFFPVPVGSYDVVTAAVNGAGTAYAATVITGVQPGNALGTVPLVAESSANTSQASVTGQVTTSTGSAVTSADIVLSALQPVQINGSQVMVTIPLASQSMATALVATASGTGCPTNTDCGVSLHPCGSCSESQCGSLQQRRKPTACSASSWPCGLRHRCGSCTAW